VGYIKGDIQYRKFLKGEKLTRKEAMLAKCYECNGLVDSREDCEVDTCPMYGYRLHPSLKT
jgi:hypothetical protein